MLQKPFAIATRLFFSPDTLAPFLVGSLFLSILGNATYDILKTWIGTDLSSLVKIALGSLVIFFAAVGVFVYRVKRLQTLMQQLPEKRSPKQHRGLVLLVSKLEPCRKAIAYHQPTLERCWLICSDQTRDLAKQLMQDYPNITCEILPKIRDVYDPIETARCLNEIYKDLPQGWVVDEVISDFTGMTAQASVGMTLVCAVKHYPLQYTPAQVDAMLKPTGSLNPIEIVLRLPKQLFGTAQP